MKFSKIFSAAAAIVAAGMMTVAASADILPVPDADKDPGLATGTADYGVQVFNVGGVEEGKDATDYGIDISKIVKFSVTFTVIEEDRVFWDGGVGGGLIISQNGGSGMPDSKSELWGKYNWPQQQWWGVNDPELGLEAAADKDVMAEKVGDYTYKLVSGEFENAIGSGDVADVGCFQVFLKEWSGNMSRVQVTSLELLDASGNVLLTFDKNGKADKPNLKAAGGDTTPSTDNSGAANNVDTGVEGVAAVVGVAALAAGAVVLSRKRK